MRETCRHQRSTAFTPMVALTASVQIKTDACSKPEKLSLKKNHHQPPTHTTTLRTLSTSNRRPPSLSQMPSPSLARSVSDSKTREARIHCRLHHRPQSTTNTKQHLHIRIHCLFPLSQPTSRACGAFFISLCGVCVIVSTHQLCFDRLWRYASGVVVEGAPSFLDNRIRDISWRDCAAMTTAPSAGTVRRSLLA